jgi:hypothetical protein
LSPSARRYRDDSSDIDGRRVIVTGRQTSGVREARAMVGGTMVPDMINGPVSEEARLLLASAGDAAATADTVKATTENEIAFILAPTSSSSAAPRPSRSGDIR